MFGYCLLSVLLIWQIVASSMAANLEATSPKQARHWRSRQPEALLSLAEGALTAGDYRNTRRYALKALNISPSVGVAYRILGQAAEQSGDPATADRLYAQAYSLTHRDAPLASILFEKDVRAGRYDQALDQAEIIMRRAPPAAGLVVIRLAALANDPRALPVLEQRLAENPDWRLAFFRELGRSGSYSAAVPIYDALARAGSPPRSDELSPVLNPMIWSGEAAEARAIWARTLPPSVRPGPSGIYNPDFRALVSGGAFDWRLAATPNGNARMAAGGEAPGLYVQLQGLDETPLASQLLVLDPGHYRLSSTAHLVDGDDADLQWRLGCDGADLGAPILLALRRPGLTVAQTEFDLRQPCNATLTLQALERNHGDPTSVVVDGVKLRRTD